MTITHKFRSVTWAAAVASAALTCYLISHRVSAERTSLEEVEGDIEQARRDILALDTEFETRSRMSQLERWSRRDLNLESPSAEQFLEGEIELAALIDGDPAKLVPLENDAAVQNASTIIERSGDDTIDKDIFEAPDPDDSSTPRLQQASYTPSSQAGRIAFLDERLRGAIADEAASEDTEGDIEDR